jgi:protein-S-isoprenylcysteine O-methyltransferase Ste14
MLGLVLEPALHLRLALGVIAAGVLVFLVLLFVSAPYGRHRRGGWGPGLPARLGWTFMESPAALVFAGVYALGAHAREAVPLVLCALWLVHYVNRAFVFPWRLRNGKKPMPALVMSMAVVFNVVNGYLNARQVSQLGSYPLEWLRDPRFVAGALAFGLGFLVNLHSDRVLLALRKPGEAGYRVPQAGLHRLVASPNYFGEIIEWGGWALATWSLAGLAFFLFTVANLVPRALSHLRWYQRTFPDYPKERRAIVPWLV